MVMAVNNSPLLTQNTDISQLSVEFRDGLKLRQEYEQRQQQKALNELMGISDFNERLAAAGQHKYAGALVPMVQQYEEERQKAALGNLKDSADIQKTFAETGKLGAEAGKIGVETEGESLKTAQGVSDYISANAVTQDPTAFGLKIGELHKRGLLTPAQTQSLLGMVQNDPQTAATLMQRMAMGNPEVAKTFLPSMQKIDLGDRVGLGQYNPMTGEYTGLGDYQVGQSPDNYANNQTSQLNAQLSNETSRENNIRTTQASMYGADQSLAGQKYRTDADSQRQYAKMEWERQQAEIKAQKGKLQSFGGKVYVVYGDGTARPALDQNGQQILDNKPSGGNNAKPAAVLKMEGELQEALTTNAHTMRQISDWYNKIKNGQFKLGGMTNLGNALANRTGINKLGDNPQDYAEFSSFIKDLATKALRLNAGVQTDSDYKRQLDAMIAGDYIPRDEKTALRLLDKMQRDFDTANKAKYNNLRQLRSEYGEKLPEYGAGGKQKQMTPSKAVTKTVKIGDAIFK